MTHDEVNGLCKIFAGCLGTTCTVLDRESVVTHFTQCDGQRESLMDGPDIGKATSDNGKRTARLSPEKEQSRIVLARIRLLVGIGVDVVEESVARMHMVDHRVDGLHGLFTCHVVMIGQQTCHVGKSHSAIINPLGRQNELPESVESFMFHNILHCIQNSQMPVSIHISVLSVREEKRQRIIEIFRHWPELMPGAVLFVKGKVGKPEDVREL